jgi:hypothetical protein
VKRVVNRLYMIRLDIDRPVCLAAQGDSPAWCWHARFGHLNFCGLRHLATGEMVKGLLRIDHVQISVIPIPPSTAFFQWSETAGQNP